MINKRTLGCASLIALMVGVACSSNDDNPTNPPGSDAGTDAGANACDSIEADVENSFALLKKFVAIPTWRTENWGNEADVDKGMQQIYDELNAQVTAINSELKTSKLQITKWEKSSDKEGGVRNPNEPPNWRVFKISLGTGARKVAVITHLDTVSPGNDSWKPFELTEKTLDYDRGKGVKFWLGRGSIDDKGPAIATLVTMKQIAKKYDGSPLLNDITVELVFDTSEETSMSTPHYFELNPQEDPSLAIIFDAGWCVRGEKGVERPIFTLPKQPAPTAGVWISSLRTPPGPANQIADTATAIIKGAAGTKFDELAAKLQADYSTYAFDDRGYRRAEISVTKEADSVKLVTKVMGAQHGSKPEENRADGANPLVSLTNFLADEANKGVLVKNDLSHMSEFIRWTWGTKVFGEGHPTLQESDDIFKAPNNGTTYAVTQLDDSGTDSVYANQLVLKVDIRYAQGHHGSAKWNGQTEGFIDKAQDKPSFSTFKKIFTDLVSDFNALDPAHPMAFTVKETRKDSPVPPDVRKTDGPTFSRVSEAYQQVMNEPCPAIAIGGGTDAKNNPKFLAAGALFSTKFGPPINFHGLEEAAPVPELTKSGKIICQFLDDEVKKAAQSKTTSTPLMTSSTPLWRPDHDTH